MRRLRIVIPILNEGEALTERLHPLQRLRSQGVEVVIVDGGSTDQSWARARPYADHLLASLPGRAQQMNLGATFEPHGVDALLFLHADTHLPADALPALTSALHASKWGRFDVTFDAPQPIFRLIGGMMNLRSRLTRIATGDMAMFMRTDAFVEIKGFPVQPLMEDIAISDRLRKLGKPANLTQQVRTSARRWLRGGTLRTILGMWQLRLAYFFGASPERLAVQYGYPPLQPLAPACVAIFAKAPIPGLAKTRLSAVLGARGAARAQRIFIGQSVHTATAAAVGHVQLHCTPSIEHPRFKSLAKRFALERFVQVSGDIGMRMNACAQAHFDSPNAVPLLMVGTDCPALGPGHLQAAARALRDAPICFIPAEDGGYVLVGMTRWIPDLFEQIEWSSPRVMAQSRARLEAVGVTWQELPSLWDVDEPADWHRYQRMMNPNTEVEPK